METTLPMYFEQQFSSEISNVLWPLFNGEISKVHIRITNFANFDKTFYSSGQWMHL